MSIFISISATALTIDSVRFGQHPDKTRFVLELDQAVDFKAFTLNKTTTTPYRIVVDLPAFSWKANNIQEPKGGNVLDVRTGTLSDQTHRIVIDVKSPPALENAFIIPKTGSKRDRLVIDFKTVSETVFNQKKGQEFGVLTTKTNIKTTTPKTTLSNIVAHHATSNTTNNSIPTPRNKPSSIQKITTTVTSSLPQTPLYRPLIVIDAGHGGNDPGAVGVGKHYEKHVTLAAAKELKQQLEVTKRYRVSLTRSTDHYIKLYKRVSIARTKEADLFISLHADSIDKKNIRGASVYTLSNKASDAQTAKLAARENQSDLIAGVDLSHEDKDVASILLDLAMRDTMNQSKFFANTVVSNMRARGIRLLDKPHRYAGFAVLKAPDIPSILIEMGFMSNKKEASMLRTPSYRQKITASIRDSIDDYFKKVRKNGS